MWPFERSSGAESKAEAAKTAGVPFPLTPTQGWGGWGEGERSKLQPQAYNDYRNCQSSRVRR